MTLAVTFLFPLVLVAAVAAAAPVIIHFVMRNKPRRIVFPAMRFVLKTHLASVSKLRLKHLLLLAMRMAAIVLVAMLIARGQSDVFGGAKRSKQPACAVVVIDNSGSMCFEYQGAAMLRRGKDMAIEIIESLPTGSRVAVLSASSPMEIPGFVGDRKIAAQQILSVPQTGSDCSVAQAVVNAVELLADVQEHRKEVYVVSDMTEQGWREMCSVADHADVNFTILRCGESGERSNLSLAALDLPRTSISLGSDTIVSTALGSKRLSAEPALRVELDGIAIDERTVVLRKDAVISLKFPIRPEREGFLHGRVILDYPDPMQLDNVRYFTIQVSPPARMLIVRNASTVGQGDKTSHFMGNAVSPSGGSGWLARTTITASRFGEVRLDDFELIMLAGAASLGDQQWQRLERYVRRGGSVWVVAGPLISVRAMNTRAAQQILPISPKSLERLEEPVALEDAPGSHPMLAMFADADNPPLSQLHCGLRLAVDSLAPQSEVLLKYADGTPAIVQRKVGDGAVLFWNLTLGREHSNLVARENPHLPILARCAAETLLARGELPGPYMWGQVVTLKLPRSMAVAAATVRRPGEKHEMPVIPDSKERTITFPVDRLGHWLVTFTARGEKHNIGFSVNAHSAESDLAGVDEASLRRYFPDGQVVITADASEVALAGETEVPADLTLPILLALIALIAGESFFANRFYKRSYEPKLSAAGRD